MGKPQSVDDGGMSARAFAERLGLGFAKVYQYIRDGRIDGARIHPLTGKWWIYPPARILPSRRESFARPAVPDEKLPPFGRPKLGEFW